MSDSNVNKIRVQQVVYLGRIQDIYGVSLSDQELAILSDSFVDLDACGATGWDDLFERSLWLKPVGELIAQLVQARNA